MNSSAAKLKNIPGRCGAYGGRYVPETLMAALEELEREYAKASRDRKFKAEFERLLKEYAGRPTPLFRADRLSKLVGVEAGGVGEQLGEHAARFRGGLPGVLQGTYSYVLQDQHGQIATTHSVSAGLDYPSIGPEHAALADSGRAEYVAASDAEGLEACTHLARPEGIIPPLESAHAVAECIKRAPRMKKSEVLVVNVSGRGDKDIGILRENVDLT